MNRAVLLAEQPKWCEFIASGKKTIEIRKAASKLQTPFKVYIYQTKKKWRYRLLEKLGLYQGKVIGEFVCDAITTLNYDTDWGGEPPQEGYFFVETPSESVLFDFNPCLTNKEMIDYGKGKPLYGWHISNLKIYDKPKKLGEFRKGYTYCKLSETDFCENGCKSHIKYDLGWECKRLKNLNKPLTRPPQSWCYVEEL